MSKAPDLSVIHHPSSENNHGLTLPAFESFVSSLSAALYARFNFKVAKKHPSKMRDLCAEAFGFTAGGYQQALAKLPQGGSGDLFQITGQTELDRLVQEINQGLGKYFTMQMSVKKLPALREVVVEALGDSLRLTEGDAVQDSGQTLWVLRDGQQVLAVFRAGMWAFHSSISKHLLENLDAFKAAMQGVKLDAVLGDHRLLCTGDIEQVFTGWQQSGSLHFTNVYCRGVDVGIARDRETAVFISGVMEGVLSSLNSKEQSGHQLSPVSEFKLQRVILSHHKARRPWVLPCISMKKTGSDMYLIKHVNYGEIGLVKDGKGYSFGASSRRFDKYQLLCGSIYSDES